VIEDLLNCLSKLPYPKEPYKRVLGQAYNATYLNEFLYKSLYRINYGDNWKNIERELMNNIPDELKNHNIIKKTLEELKKKIKPQEEKK